MQRSFVGADEISSILGTAENRKNVIVSQVVPLPTDTTDPLVEAYQAAMTNLAEASGGAANYTFVSLEGYLVGQFAVEVLKSIDIFARSEFPKAVYSMQNIKVSDSLTLGPFELPEGFQPGKNEDEAMDGCNQGMRKVWLTRMTDEGSFEYVPGAKDLEFPDTCGLHEQTCAEGYQRALPELTCELIPQAPREYLMGFGAFQVLTRLPFMMFPFVVLLYKECRGSKRFEWLRFRKG